MNHWYEWIDSIEFQELFEKIAVYVDDKIKESLDEFRKEIIDTYKINIQTSLNGKSITNSVIKQEIYNTVFRDFLK